MILYISFVAPTLLITEPSPKLPNDLLHVMWDAKPRSLDNVSMHIFV